MQTTFKLRGNYESGNVWLNDKPLSPEKSLKVKNHSPTGFAWAYSGSGPSQLALAVCLELFTYEIATAIYQNFKERIIARLDADDFDVTITIKIYNNTILNTAITKN